MVGKKGKKDGMVKKAEKMIERFEERQIELEERKRQLKSLLSETEDEIKEVVQNRKKWEREEAWKKLED